MFLHEHLDIGFWRLIYRHLKFIIYRKVTNFKGQKRGGNMGKNKQQKCLLNKRELEKTMKLRVKTKKGKKKLSPNCKL